MKRDYVFKGYDYYELVQCFDDELDHSGLEGKTGWEEEDIMVERLKVLLSEKCNHFNVDTDAVLKVREFIDAICKMGELYDFPHRYIWEGLQKTKDDVAFIDGVTACMYLLWN